MLALCTAVTRRPLVAPGVLEGEAGDAQRRHLGDDLEALDHAGDHDVLEPGVEVLGVLADDDQVHALVARSHVGQVPHRAEVGVEVERLAQPDVDAGEARPDRRRDRALERDLGAADRLEQRLGQRGAVLVDGGGAGRNGSQAARRPAASSTWTTARVTSGPMPSPGMSVIGWVMGGRAIRGLPRRRRPGRPGRWR